MTHRKTLLAAAALIAVSAAMLGRSFAQPAPAPAPAAPTVVATCNVAELFRLSDRANDLTREFEKRKTDLEAEGQAMANKAQEAQALLQELKEGTADFEKQLASVRRMGIELKVWEETQRATMNYDRMELTRQLYDDMRAAVASVAQQRGIDLVIYYQPRQASGRDMSEMIDDIETRSVLYGAARLDITEPVLRQLNAAYRSARP